MADLKKLLIETPVDKLIELLEKRKRVSLSEASRVLGASEENIEEWARALEEHGFVKLIYPAIGPPVIELGEGKIPEEKEEFAEVEEVGAERGKTPSLSIEKKPSIFSSISKIFKRKRLKKRKRKLRKIAEVKKRKPHHKKKIHKKKLKIKQKKKIMYRKGRRRKH